MSTACQPSTSPLSPVAVTSSGVRPAPLARVAKQRVYESTAIVQNASSVRSSGRPEASSDDKPLAAAQHRLQVLEDRREVGQCQSVERVESAHRGERGGVEVVGHLTPIGGWRD